MFAKGFLNKGFPPSKKEAPTKPQKKRAPPPVPAVPVERNWAKLPSEVLSLIFRKIGAIELLMSAQYVCRPWRQLSFQPHVWRCVDMTIQLQVCGGSFMEQVAREAIDRSQGKLEEFHSKYFGSDHLLRYIADRTSRLKSLRLVQPYGVSAEGLAEMVRKYPLLEELEISFYSFATEDLKVVGKLCSQLKCFRLNSRINWDDRGKVSDEEAHIIARSMPELRQLQIFGNKLTNAGLLEILDKCPHLEALDIRRCFNVNMNESMQVKCAKIKDLKLPNDPYVDYDYYFGEMDFPFNGQSQFEFCQSDDDDEDNEDDDDDDDNPYAY